MYVYNYVEGFMVVHYVIISPSLRHLQTGEHYLCVWSTTEGANPIGTCDGNHSDDDSMILQVAFDRRSNAVVYDDVVNTKR